MNKNKEKQVRKAITKMTGFKYLQGDIIFVFKGGGQWEVVEATNEYYILKGIKGEDKEIPPFTVSRIDCENDTTRLEI